ncbi:MAG: DUF4097 family beta strand repeat-containing protein [Chloroherpetonaceae bacterium]|nr:DUF4097 family beta strand repeat-containing protein [Chloroherpetonaceae bacterium]
MKNKLEFWMNHRLEIAWDKVVPALVLFCALSVVSLYASPLSSEMPLVQKAKEAKKDENVEVTKTFQVTKGGTLEVVTDMGEIRVSTYDKNEVTVSVSGYDEEDVDKIKITQLGNTVRVTFRVRRNINGWGRGGNDVRFDVKIPSQFNLDLRTSAGDIELSGAIIGEVKLNTSGGDLLGSDITGNIDASTSGGDIRFGTVKGNGYIKTSGGDISLSDVGGDLEVKTAGGTIRVNNIAKTLRAKTSGGDIQIGDVGGEATLSTAGGDLRVGKVNGRASLSTAGGNIEVRGAQGYVNAKTSGGSLRLENITGSIDGKTAGGDIYAELTPESSGRTMLASSAGNIELFVTENAKANIQAKIRVASFGNYYNWGRRRSDRSKKDSGFNIHSDFPATTQNVSGEEESTSNEIFESYVLGGGGHIINLETVMGNIYIRKARKSSSSGK